MMARASRKDPVDRDALPEGMKVFTVTGATIKDSLGAYCVSGQEAVLNEKDAKIYHKARQIAADLPDFAVPSGPTPEEAQAALDALAAMQAQMEKERADFAAALAAKEAALAEKEAVLAAATEKTAEEGTSDAGKPGADEGGEAETAAVSNRRSAKA